MPTDPRLTYEISRSTQIQHTANRIARTANQLEYVKILLGAGQDVPKELADEIALAVGDSSYRLATLSGL